MIRSSEQQHSATPIATGDGKALTRAGQCKGIVLAGSHVWGDFVLEQIASWSMAPVAGRPLIEHILTWFNSARMPSVSICTNGNAVALHEHLGDAFTGDMTLDYSQDVYPRGPAGCVRDVTEHSDADIYAVVDGSIMPNIDLADLIDAHRASNAILTVAATSHTSGGATNGSLEPAGIYIFSRSVVEHTSPVGYQDIKETLVPKLYAAGLPVHTYVVADNALPRIRSATTYLHVNRWATEHLLRSHGISGDYVRIADALVHKSVRLDSSARLIGPILIEPGCTIDSGSVIVGPTTLGVNTRVGRDTVISRSAVWADCTIADRTVIDDCVITDESIVDSGTAVTNSVYVPAPSSMARIAKAKTSRIA